MQRDLMLRKKQKRKRAKTQKGKKAKLQKAKLQKHKVQIFFLIFKLQRKLSDEQFSPYTNQHMN